MIEKIAKAHEDYMAAGWAWQEACVEELKKIAKKQYPKAMTLMVTAILDLNYTEHHVEAVGAHGNVLGTLEFDDADQEMLLTEGACFAEGEYTTIIL